MSNSNLPSPVKTVLIFGAMNVETEYMVSKLSDVKKTSVAGYPFFDGTYKGKRKVEQSGQLE